MGHYQVEDLVQLFRCKIEPFFGVDCPQFVTGSRHQIRDAVGDILFHLLEFQELVDKGAGLLGRCLCELVGMLDTLTKLVGHLFSGLEPGCLHHEKSVPQLGKQHPLFTYNAFYLHANHYC